MSKGKTDFKGLQDIRVSPDENLKFLHNLKLP